MKKNKNKNKNFIPLVSSLERKAKNREERIIGEELPLMLFSFNDFQYNNQIPPGQKYCQWQEDDLLAYMLEKFGSIYNYNRIEAEQMKLIKVYGNFPENSGFKNPFPDNDIDWAVVMKIKGQKGRVAGYIVGHIFYVVFLDAEHKFFPTEKKNT